jgi:hypothetical protein
MPRIMGMATVNSDPPWTPVKCQACNWRGPLGKATKDAHGYCLCPKCLTPVIKVKK